MNRAFYMLLFTFSLYGCNVEMSQKVNETLYQAENCMEEFPDSALSLLQHISHPEDLKGKAQADYALLYSQACDKNRISITNDSLIRIAVRYYKDKDEDLNAAKSYFYLGCVYRNANQDAMAIEAYLKALDKMPKGKPHKLWMQKYFKLGINVLSNLNSIHVPSLITCFEEDFAQCFVETYIPGINARQYFQNHRCLFKKYRLLIDVLKVLQDLHQIGYLYIDLKLENIIYYQNHFYLIDFNACIENHSHVAVMASKSNCAPELLTLSEKDIRCDIYALGSLIQELFGIA